MVFSQKIPSRGPSMSLAASAWRSTAACLPTEAGELTHRPSCVVRLQDTVLPVRYPVLHLESDK